MAPRRSLALLLAAWLGAGTALAPSPALAVPRGYVLVSAQLLIVGNAIVPNPFCVGEPMKLGPIIGTAVEYRNPAGRRLAYLRPTGRVERIRVTSADPGVVSVSPSVAVQAPTGLRPSAIMVVTANRAGHTTVTLSDDLYGQAPSISVPVEVRDCHYEVTMSSTWRLRKGFRPTLHSSLTSVPLRPTGVFNSYLATPRMANSATAPPSGGCTVTFAIGRSDVTITAVPDPQRLEIMQVTLQFAALPKPALQVCYVPHAMGPGEGSGQPQPLTFRIDANARRTTKTLRHVINADEVATGSTEITIERVPNP